MSESDVYRRQILTYKDGPRAERVIVLYFPLYKVTYLRPFDTKGTIYVLPVFTGGVMPPWTLVILTTWLCGSTALLTARTMEAVVSSSPAPPSDLARWELGRNTTRLLDHLLQGYDRRLRPGFGGEFYYCRSLGAKGCYLSL